LDIKFINQFLSHFWTSNLFSLGII